MLCAKGSQLKGELQFMAPFSPCKIDYLYILHYTTGLNLLPIIEEIELKLEKLPNISHGIIV